MGGKHSKGKISHDDLEYLLQNTNHSTEEIKEMFERFDDSFNKLHLGCYLPLILCVLSVSI